MLRSSWWMELFPLYMDMIVNDYSRTYDFMYSTSEVLRIKYSMYQYWYTSVYVRLPVLTHFNFSNFLARTMTHIEISKQYIISKE